MALRKSYSLLFNEDDLAPEERRAARAYGEQTGGSVNLNDWKKPATPVQDLRVTQAAQAAIQSPAPQALKPSVSTPAVQSNPAVPPPPPPPPAPVVYGNAPGNMPGGATPGMVNTAPTSAQYGTKNGQFDWTNYVTQTNNHTDSPDVAATAALTAERMTPGYVAGTDRLDDRQEIDFLRDAGHTDPEYIARASGPAGAAAIAGNPVKLPGPNDDVIGGAYNPAPVNPGGGFVDPVTGKPIVGPIADAGLPNVPPGTSGPQAPAVSMPPVQSGAAANAAAGLDKPVNITAGSATPSTFEPDARITDAIMQALGPSAQTGPDDAYLTRGREVIDTRFDRQLEDQNRRNDEFMSSRGIIGSSIEDDSRRNIERDVSEARAAAEFDLLNNDRQYGLSRDSLNLQGQGQRGNLALGAGSMGLQANAQKLDNLFRDKSLNVQTQIENVRMELQRQGMSADNAYRYASLAQDSNFRAEALKLQQQGLSMDEAYRQAELKFRQGAADREIGQRDRALGQDDFRNMMAALDAIQNSGVPLDEATRKALQERIKTLSAA
jgi:hypothetical protein